jgi:GntR family transcriptional regulator/MocR family aminotransferase
MSDLHIVINRFLLDQPSTSPSRQHRLYSLLKQAILTGQLTASTPMPSTRALALELDIARNTVIHAYEQLLTEGFVISSRQGTIVAALGTQLPAKGNSETTDQLSPLSLRAKRCAGGRVPEDVVKPFKPGVPAVDAFPFQTWRRLLVHELQQVKAHELGYRDPAGEPELRRAISDYLRASRGVCCTADQVVVTSGTQQSLDLCSRLLADLGDIAWIENPGYQGARTALQESGLLLKPISVDQDGISPRDADWDSSPPKLIYTSPSHQYPLGSVLALERRLKLIRQAKQYGSWILEDDYDSEFRHIGPPLSAMQGLVDDAPVVYMGTFSKSMFPGLRLGFFVLPPHLAEKAMVSLDAWVRTGHVPEQRALAAFIEDGYYSRHLRRMRQLYSIRQNHLKRALEEFWPLPYNLLGGAGGMHVVITLPPRICDRDVARQARNRGLCPSPLSGYNICPESTFNGLVLGYANVHEQDMARQIRILVSCLESGAGGRMDSCTQHENRMQYVRSLNLEKSPTLDID